MTQDKPLSPIWWLALPALFFLANAGLQIWADPELVKGILMENGPYELLQAVIIFSAFLVGASSIPLAHQTHDRNLIIWVGLATFGTFYISGEEISWGQQFFQWSTPDSWMAVNDHHETNLHNTSEWFDQKPKAILEVGILISAIFIPLYRRFKPSAFLDKFNMVLPPCYLWVTAAVLWTFKIVKDLDGHFHFINLTRTSELNEVCVYYFMLIYLVAFRMRLKNFSKN